jgi:hypothetical protein
MASDATCHRSVRSAYFLAAAMGAKVRQQQRRLLVESPLDNQAPAAVLRAEELHQPPRPGVSSVRFLRFLVQGNGWIRSLFRVSS